MNNPNDSEIEFYIGKPEVTLFGRFKQALGIDFGYQGKWRIHQNDADPFPSDFHAHRLDKAETLDLYTGDVFDPRTRQQTRTMKEKDMRFVFEDLQRSKNKFVNQKVQAKDKFVYLD